MGSRYNEPMRIVFVGPFAMQPKRTMAVRALPLAKALAARGHQVLVLLPPWDAPLNAGKDWMEDSVRVRNVRLPPSVPLVHHLLLTRRLLRAALRHRPDVIHCFKPKSYAGLTAWAVWQAKRLGWTRARLVVDADDWEGTGGWNERYTQFLTAIHDSGYPNFRDVLSLGNNKEILFTQECINNFGKNFEHILRSRRSLDFTRIKL